jgi:glycosyltransferase involved in cell wall biosynthesis
MRSLSTILIVGQASQKTGLARITRAIAGSLSAYYDVHVLGIDCFDDSPVDARFTLHGNPLSYDRFAELRLTTLLDELRPDAVLLYHDFWIIERYHERIARANHRCPVAGYCPVDGPIADTAHLASLAPLDELVVFTEFARGVIRQCDPNRTVRVIPHGIDTSEFYPARKPHDGFIVLNANRNQPRKRLDLTLQGFAQFAAGKPADVKLYLHCGLNDIGVDILSEARTLAIADRLLFTHDRDDHPDSSTQSLNEIYNTCDVGVNTAIGEGWGLIACEHAATGAAQIVPRHSACAEIWDGAADFLEPINDCRDPFYEGGIIDPADLAQCLERLYADPHYRQERARAAYDRITNPRYRWDRIAEQWRALFEELMTRQGANHELSICQ